jgi:hypothetical protein
MTMKFNQLASPLLITGGLVLAAGGFVSLNDDATPVHHSRNAFAVQGSAYGKLLARLSETTIDRVWHLGVEQIVPHYMSGIGPGQKQAAQKTEAGKTASPAAKKASLEKPRTPLQNGKRWFQDRVIAQHHRTNPNGMSDRHLATVYRDIEEMLLRSFKLDPTHYGAYDSYHLFLTTHDFGGTPLANAQAAKVAQFAMAAAFQETEDPEPWLTAVAAGMNLYLMDAAPYMKKSETIPIEIVKEYREKIGYCLAKFDEIQAKAESNGNWDRLSMERQMEIAERSLFAKRTFKQFDAMIARAEHPATPADPNGAVVKSENPDEKP